MIFNDIVNSGTPTPVVKDYKPVLHDDQKLQSTFIEHNIHKPIENLPKHWLTGSRIMTENI